MTTPVSNTAQRKKTVIFIVGPTAIGKTAFAIKLARRIGGEIVSADSMQVYKGMRCLSQAPGAAENRIARHHLAGSLDPNKEYNAAVFIKEASAIIESIMKRGNVPIVTGGSGLYVKRLIDGLFPSPNADLKFRRKMGKFAAKYGSRRLHSRLSKIDSASAGAIHPNDTRRIIRALEIYNSTGRTMTELKASTCGLKDRYTIKIIGLTRPREEIYSQIDMRVNKMFKAGVVREVRALKRKRLSKTAREVLGFKEISGYLGGRYDKDAVKDMLKMNTRRFAKRQLTWFRADRRIRWFDVSKTNDKNLIKKAVKLLG